MMEWIKDNPVHFMVYIALAGFTTYYIFFGREHKGRSLKDMTENNKASLCAGCGNRYQDNYYTIDGFIYCASCFKRIFYEKEVELKLFGAGLIIYAIVTLSSFIPELISGKFNYNYFWSLLIVVIFGPRYLSRVLREYRELKKAGDAHHGALK